MIGVSESHFWDSTPEELKPYRRMDEMCEERTDYHMWVMGQYMMSAVQTAVSNVLAGKKSKAQYIEQPIMQMTKEETQQSDPNADFNKFCAWAVVFNESFKKKEGQG